MRIKKTEYRIQNTEYRTQNTEYRIQNTEYRTQNTGHRIQNTGHRKNLATKRRKKHKIFLRLLSFFVAKKFRIESWRSKIEKLRC